MITLLTDLRKTALVAGVAMGASALWALILIAARLPQTSFSAFAAIAAIVLGLLFDLPPLVLLLLLYRTAITLTISRNLRYVAQAMALIQGANIAVSVLSQWRRGISASPGYIELPANSLSLWFYQSSARVLISDAVSLLSTLSFVLFLVALSRQTGVGPKVGERQSRLVRKAARIAALVAGATLILGVATGVRHQSAASLVRSALTDLPGFIAPLIIYVSIRTSRKTIDAEPLSAPLGQTA